MRLSDFLGRRVVSRLAALACILGFGSWAARGFCQQAPAGAGSPAAQLTGIGAQTPPDVNVKPSAADRFQVDDSVASLPVVFGRQWYPGERMVPESIINEPYLRTADVTTSRVTLKQAIYLAIANNPNVTAYQLDPVAGTEAIRMAYGTFDPDLQATLDTNKSVSPA